MRRLTTPTHRFTLPLDDVSIIERIRITYAQYGEIVLVKDEYDIDYDGCDAVVKLTQEETKLFNDQKKDEIQVHVLTSGGDSLVSNIIKVDCDRVLNDEVLV